MPVVYLIHWPRATAYGRHYLGLAPAEALIDLEAIPHGYGYRRPAEGQQEAPEGSVAPSAPILADVWDCGSVAEASRLLLKFRKQGGRGRLCSICHPNNARGDGRGKWQRQGANK